jgi:hypothetical protein
MAAIRNSQEKTEAAINFIRAELEEIIKHRVEGILTSVDQQTQDLREKLDARIGKTQWDYRCPGSGLASHSSSTPVVFGLYARLGGTAFPRMSWISFFGAWLLGTRPAARESS